MTDKAIYVIKIQLNFHYKPNISNTKYTWIFTIFEFFDDTCNFILGINN